MIEFKTQNQYFMENYNIDYLKSLLKHQIDNSNTLKESLISENMRLSMVNWMLEVSLLFSSMTK